ncbi:MAG: DUF1800 domain-containing protein [Rhodothermaceae bacterium]|nr:DUF1800 domain-containing protein [Rhodothermaceae bacterium]
MISAAVSSNKPANGKYDSVMSTGLPPFNGSWTKVQAAHLVRRTHFGIRTNNLNFVRSFPNATQAVTALVNNAKSTPLPDNPQWFNSGTSGNILHMYDTQFRWMDSMYNGGLLQRMMLFWSNHFAVSYSNMNALPDKAGNSYASHMYKYWTLLHLQSFADFKTIVSQFSKNSAMVYYLNNYNYRAGEPNQDFARELMELFTIGPTDKNGADNYSENDVAEVSRAVTGWRVNDGALSSYFDASRHDTGSKTVFGQTGNYDLDGVINLIFEHRREQAAWFICRKLYVYFVSAEPDTTVIDSMAAYCIHQNFDISAVLTNLLSSSHFYQDRFMGCRIKSPIELFISYLRELEITPTTQIKEYIRLRMQDSNEELLRPETVFGWDGYNPPYSDGSPGHYSWINTNLMPARWDNLNSLINGSAGTGSSFNPISLIEKISDPHNPFTIAEDLAGYILAVPLNRLEVRIVEDDFAGDPNLAPNLTGFPEHKINLSKILLGSIPWYEWRVDADQSGNLYYQPVFAESIRQYISYLQQLPSYQLI